MRRPPTEPWSRAAAAASAANDPAHSYRSSLHAHGCPQSESHRIRQPRPTSTWRRVKGVLSPQLRHDRNVIRWRDPFKRLAAPMSRRPLRIALAALVVSALGATGLFRFAVDSGQSLLVGSSSSAGQTYATFSQTFGSDPIVLVFTARNPTAPYIEHNL